MSDEYTMYLIVNDDLKMGKGKIAAQVGHAVQKIIEDILEKYYISKKSNTYDKYIKWKNGSKKIVLKASKSELLHFTTYAESVSIYDCGLTQIPHNSLTVVGFYPSNSNKNMFTNYKLL